MKKLAFFASHSGSNFKAIIKNCLNGTINAEPTLLITNNSNSGAFVFAKENKIAAYHISPLTSDNPDNEILEILLKHNIDLIVLAGYMKKIPADVIKHFPNKIINIHPSLLPKYGGKGMYGLNVHKAVIDNKELFSGLTIHYVTEKYDDGEYLIQFALKVNENETPESLQTRILEYEHLLYSKVIADLVKQESE
jgi:phosphoribosylglycinamide formyltransferase-1